MWLTGGTQDGAWAPLPTLRLGPRSCACSGCSSLQGLSTKACSHGTRDKGTGQPSSQQPVSHCDVKTEESVLGAWTPSLAHLCGGNLPCGSPFPQDEYAQRGRDGCGSHWSDPPPDGYSNFCSWFLTFLKLLL